MPPAYRKIGDTLVHPVGFGAMGFAIALAYGAIESDEERFKLLDAAYQKGSRHWDSANVYGDSEEIIGKWFKRTGRRSDIFLATKFGFGMTGVRGDAAYVRQCVEESLAKLGVETIDLYYFHRVDPKTPIEYTVRAMAELVKEGKVRFLGLSECSASALRRAHAVHPITALQVEYSPFELSIEDPRIDLLKTARELGITIVAYSPLGRGLLTGAFKSPDDFEETDFRRLVPKYSADNFPKILKVVDRIRAIGDKHKATPGQVSLAWLLAQGDDVVVIPGTKKIKYLEENIAAAEVPLTPEEVAEVRRIAQDAERDITGARYPEGPAGMDWLYIDSPLPEEGK